MRSYYGQVEKQKQQRKQVRSEEGLMKPDQVVVVMEEDQRERE